MMRQHQVSCQVSSQKFPVFEIVLLSESSVWFQALTDSKEDQLCLAAIQYLRQGPLTVDFCLKLHRDLQHFSTCGIQLRSPGTKVNHLGPFINHPSFSSFLLCSPSSGVTSKKQPISTSGSWWRIDPVDFGRKHLVKLDQNNIK